MTLYNDGQKLENELIFRQSREFAGQKKIFKKQESMKMLFVI